MSTPHGTRVRPLEPEMRWMLLGASVLVLVAGLQLFVFSEHTDRYFAWTINPPLTAAFLGAGFWASFILESLASRERTWARARVAVPAVLVFSTLMLISTLLHIDRFHLDTPFGWTWIAVYVLVPPLMLFVLFRQLRSAGGELSPGQPLPSWIRYALGGQASGLLALGTALFLAPLTVAPIWPWMLTPLTARAVAAWLVGIGVAAAHVSLENNLATARIAFTSYAIFGLLELLALTRYQGTLDWASARSWFYPFFLLSMLVVGLAGWRATRESA